MLQATTSDPICYSMTELPDRAARACNDSRCVVAVCNFDRYCEGAQGFVVKSSRRMRADSQVLSGRGVNEDVARGKGGVIFCI